MLHNTNEPSGRFFTNADIGSVLINLLSAKSPKRIIDLGAGLGSLSIAANSRWSDAEIVTVDVVPNVGRPTFAWAHRNVAVQHTHYVADVLDVSLPDLVLSGSEHFDVAICNPPYIKPVWREGFERILQEVGLNTNCYIRQSTTADVIFIAQNLRLTKAGGHLGLIVPDGLISSASFAYFRDFLLRNHCVKRVVQLPRSSFRKTDAQAYIMIIRKAHPAPHQIALQILHRDGKLSPSLMIDIEQGVKRLDYGFHVGMNAASPTKNSKTLRQIGATVERGRISSHLIASHHYPVFHTNNFPSERRERYTVPTHLRVPKGEQLDPRLVVAEAGDILLARVHRSLAKKVCLIEEGSCVISDTVFRIRVTDNWRSRVLAMLLSPDGQEIINATSRGVGARFLAAADLLQVPLIDEFQGQI